MKLQRARTPDGIFYVQENDVVAKRLLKGEAWEPHFGALVRAVVQPGDVVADIGANIGYNTVVLARQVGENGRVLAFEPQSQIRQQLTTNVSENGFGFNVTIFPFALGDQDGQTLQLEPIDYGAEVVNVGDTKIGQGGESIQLRTLDSFNLNRLNFIKIDVQGFETRALRGGAETIRRCRPLMFVEVEEWNLKAQSTSAVELIGTILEQKYTIVWIKNDWPVDQVCIPKEYESNYLEKGIASLTSDDDILRAE